MEKGFPSCPPCSSPRFLLSCSHCLPHPSTPALTSRSGVCRCPGGSANPQGCSQVQAEPLQHTGCSSVGKHNAGQALLYR